MNDKRGTRSAGRNGIAKPVETKKTADSLRLTAYGQDEDEIRVGEGAADSLRLAAPDGCCARNTSEPLAVSRKPMAVLDALVHELYGGRNQNRWRKAEAKRRKTWGAALRFRELTVDRGDGARRVRAFPRSGNDHR